MAVPKYPFVPRSAGSLKRGQFWAIPLSDGSYACGVVIGPYKAEGPGSRSWFVGALVDWWGPKPPTAADLGGSSLVAGMVLRTETITDTGGAILGERPLPPGTPDGSTVKRMMTTEGLLRTAERRWVALEPERVRPLHATVRSPVDLERLPTAHDVLGWVQFNESLTEEDHQVLAGWLLGRPGVGLRMYPGRDVGTDVEFLRYYPFIKRLAIEVHGLVSLDGLNHVETGLLQLTLGSTRRTMDLKVLERFTGLRRLYLEKHRKNIEVVAGMEQLRDLTLRSVTLSDLSLLKPLRQLRALDLKLGGTKDLALLPELAPISYFEAWQVLGLADLSALSEVTSLQHLFLQSLRQVQTLPDLSRLTALRRVHIENMKGISDLAPLAKAPSLRDLFVVDMPHLHVEDFAPLVGHPTLRSVRSGLGSHRKNHGVEQLLGLPSASRWVDRYLRA
jgi:hypothetical protein